MIGYLYGVPFEEWREVQELLLEQRNKGPLEALREILHILDTERKSSRWGREWLGSLAETRARAAGEEK